MFNFKRIIFEKGILDIDVGKKIYNKFRDNKDVEIINILLNRIKEYILGENLYE